MRPRTPGIILRNVGKTLKLTSASADDAAIKKPPAVLLTAKLTLGKET